ncbi:unnamed protein product [Calypogeia fissa]
MFWLIDVDTSRRYLEAAIKQSARQISHVFPHRGKVRLCVAAALFDLKVFKTMSGNLRSPGYLAIIV